MARPAVAAERLVRHLGHVRAAHDDRHPGRADRVGHAVGLGDHPRHGADADEVDPLVAHVTRDLLLVHGLGVAVDQHDFMAGRSERLEEKHP